MGALLLDIFGLFGWGDQDRVFSRALVEELSIRCSDRPWMELLRGHTLTERWLSRQLRPYGVKPKTLRINQERAKGYLLKDFRDVFRRYIPKSEVAALRAQAEDQQQEPGEAPPERKVSRGPGISPGPANSGMPNKAPESSPARSAEEVMESCQRLLEAIQKSEAPAAAGT
jgi:hypothetical protein